MGKGLYIAFEGGEGSGKSTQARLLFERLTKEQPGRKVAITREPGGTALSESIREILLKNNGQEGKETITEAYLFATCRAQSLRRAIEPVLCEGGIAIADRSVISSLAYQGYGRLMSTRTVWDINRQAVGQLFPDIVFLIDIEPETGLKRVRATRGDQINDFDLEALEFHRRVRFGFCNLAEWNPKRFIIVDGNKSIEAQHEFIWNEMGSLTKKEGREPAREFIVCRERGY